MNTATLYRDLTVQGVNLYLEGDALRYRALKGKMTPEVLANIKQHKLELISFLATLDGTKPNYLQRYRHLITCQQCEHLTLTGYCRVKPLVKPIPQAMIDCVSFEQVQTARATITSTPYSQAELTALLSKRQTSLLHHVRQCQHCNIEAVRYCADGLALMDACESVLMAFDTTEQQHRQLFLLSLHGKIPE